MSGWETVQQSNKMSKRCLCKWAHVCLNSGVEIRETSQDTGDCNLSHELMESLSSNWWSIRDQGCGVVPMRNIGKINLNHCVRSYQIQSDWSRLNQQVVAACANQSTAWEDGRNYTKLWNTQDVKLFHSLSSVHSDKRWNKVPESSYL